MSDAAMNSGAVGATLAVTQTISLWTVLMPPVADIRRHGDPDGDHPFTADIRQSELVAGGLSLTVGAIMSRLEGSWTPFLATSALVLILVLAYEYTLRVPGNSATLTALHPDERAGT